nr:unnamed protein product [Callosobruchus chinensis]
MVNAVISYDSSRGGVSVITEKGDVTTSFLLIQHADISDSGKYSCSPSNADVASVRVHVLNGERPAAMQTGSAGLSNSSFNIFLLIVISYLYTSCCLDSFQFRELPIRDQLIPRIAHLSKAEDWYVHPPKASTAAK